jgi:hypothetical protein
MEPTLSAPPSRSAFRMRSHKKNARIVAASNMSPSGRSLMARTVAK